ncbi:flagellar motor switch protein FliN [Alienimonas californiensis]|uniref:Flagellar motor switch protein FliN n=1 Tax=Alienimonas californiensis TaxID=2527989 RepID=A0A517PE33_9PLAN|nr:flagellar motor switch protein FliN [Alienimonas californiensis]QDT17629.1 Flagellar motor switch protein FliN [Alienimonas californiensis]
MAASDQSADPSADAPAAGAPPADVQAGGGYGAGRDDAEPGATGETLPSDDIEALLAAAAAGSVQMPPEDDEGTDPEPDDGTFSRLGDRDDDDAGDPYAAHGTSAASGSAPGRREAATSIPVGGQVEKLLEEVEAEVRRGRRPVLSAGQNPPDSLGRTSPLQLEAFAESGRSAGGSRGTGEGLGALDDVELDLRIELGRAEMSLEEVVALRDGSVVSLDKLAGDPVDILVNGRLVARGEVLVLNDNFCVRVAEILAPDR